MRPIPTDIILGTSRDTAAGRLARTAWACEGVNTLLANDLKTVLLERDQALKAVADLEAKLREITTSNEQLDLGLLEGIRLVATRGLQLVTDRWAA